MIGSLSGTLTEMEISGENAVQIVIDVAGVGYLVSIGARASSNLGPVGSPIALSIYTHVRESAITLYGFAGVEERKMFESLLGAHGVGPALALAVLSALSPESLRRAVANADLDALELVPGIGRKTAQRLVLDLQSRFELLPRMTSSSEVPGKAPADLEVREALSALGYGGDEIRQAMEKIPSEGSIEELLRDALRELAPRR